MTFESLFPPFFKWGSCKSEDENNPDKVKVRVKELETHDSTYSTNVEADIEEDGEWVTYTLPLKQHESPNSSLLQQWNRAVKKGLIKVGDVLVIKTWRGKSRNDRTIRKFSLGKS